MRVNERMKKVFSILLCLCMVLQYAPTTAFAVDAAEGGLCEHHTAHTADCGYVASVSGSDCTFHCHICQVQTLVDALPDEVTAENVEAVEAQLTAIDEEKASLSDEELAQVDFAKYTAAISAINDLAGQTGTQEAVTTDTSDFKISDGVLIQYLGSDESVEIPDGVTEIGQGAFKDNYSITSVKIPNSVTTIGQGAFRSAKNLRTVNIPASVTSIGKEAFYNTDIRALQLPDSLTSIGEKAFYQSWLVTVDFYRTGNRADLVIGEQAFRGSINLSAVNLASVSRIDSYAFQGCDNLTEMQYWGETIPTYGAQPFSGTQISNVYVTDAYTSTLFCTMPVSVIYYSITTSAEPGRGGYASLVSRDSAFSLADKTVYVSATPRAGYNFVGWKYEGEIVSTVQFYSFTMPAKAVTYTAVFEKNHTCDNTTYTDAGNGTHSYECSVCGINAENHSYVNGKCVCGRSEPKLVLGTVTGQYPVGWGTEVNLSGDKELTAARGKTQWETGDEIFLTLTSQTYGAKTITLTYDGSAWTADGYFQYAEGEELTVTAIYAPCYTCVDGTLQLADGMKLGMTEYLEAACQIKNGAIDVSFENVSRNYSRARIMSTYPKVIVYIGGTGFVPAGSTEVIEGRYELSNDEDGNTYLYGRFAENTIIQAGYGSDSSFINYTFPEGGGETASGTSYALCITHGGGTEQTCRGYQCTTCGGWYGEASAHTFYYGNGTCWNCGEFLAGMREIKGEYITYYEYDDVVDGMTFSYGTGTLQLLRDIELEPGAYLTITSGTLDLNGYTLYSTNNHAVYVSDELTVMDSSSAGNGQIRSSNSASGSGITGYPTSALYGTNDHFCITVKGDVEINGSYTFLSGNNSGSNNFDLTQWNNVATSSIYLINQPSDVYSSILLPVGYGLTYHGTFVPRSDSYLVPASGVLIVEKCNNHTEGSPICGGYQCAICNSWFGEADASDHIPTYTASGDTISASCSKCSTMMGTATIFARDATYDGNEQKTATVAYSSGWPGGPLYPTYVNNICAGTATASITKEDATASMAFTIAPEMIYIAEATLADVVRNGSDIYDLTVTNITFRNVVDGDTLTLGEDYTATAEQLEISGSNLTGYVVVAKVTVTLLNSNYTLGTGDNYKTYANIVEHEHDWKYTADGNTITATCSAEGCPDPEQSVTLAVPENYTYTGEALYSASVEDSIEGVTYSVLYTGANTGYNSAAAPVNADTYTVTMTVGDKSVSDTFTISPKNIANCTASLSQNSFTYDGKAPALTVSVADNGVGSTPLTEDIDYTVGTIQVNAGSHKLTVTGIGNYTGTKELNFAINPKTITVTADALSKTYGDADPKLTYKVEGLVNGDELTGELKRAAGENVGDYAIEQNTLTAGNNYRLTYTGAKLTINAKAITEADVELNGSLTYNGKEQTQPITVTEGITYEVSGNKATNVGTYELTVKGTGNYTGSVTLDWTIAKAKLTITADSKVIYIGEQLPTLTYTVSGLVGGEKLAKEPALTTNADAGQAGSYTITAANADAGDNYTITYVSGSLTIMDKETKVETKIEQTELTEVPDGLKDTQFDTVEKITEELISKILATYTGYSAENMVHYDVTLHFSLDGGDSWILATEENFPTEGITVILPYPEGTNARDYEFVVSHMFTVTSQRLGTVAGKVEMPKVEETANGIRVTLNGLSPVTVAARYHDHTGGTATCTDKAICDLCGTAYGELDATKHAGGTEVKNVKEATCGAEGYTGDTHCKGCGEIVEKGTAIKAAGEHTYGSWKVVKEPTKTTKGEKQRTCSVCGHVDSKEIPVLSDTPATGDDSSIILYGSMFTVSLAGLVVLLLAAKKRKQENA